MKNKLFELGIIVFLFALSIFGGSQHMKATKLEKQNEFLIKNAKCDSKKLYQKGYHAAYKHCERTKEKLNKIKKLSR